MTKFVPVAKMSKKDKKAYYAKKRGVSVPPSKVGKTVHEYKTKKANLKVGEF